MPNGTPVSHDLFDATQKDNDRRLATLERFADRLGGAEQEHRGLSDRITVLEQAGKAETASQTGRRERTWALALMLIGSLVLPILVTAIIAYLHLRSYH